VGRTRPRAGSPSGLDFTATCLGSEHKPAADPKFPRSGGALIAGSGDRCPLCRRDSEEGHGAFRTRVRRLPQGKIEKGSVISRSRGNPELSPSWQGGPSGPPASFHLYPALAFPEPTVHPCYCRKFFVGCVLHTMNPAVINYGEFGGTGVSPVHDIASAKVFSTIHVLLIPPNPP
jgi:hypothetical protein